ncbi:MAG: type II secretion system protein [Phycisphaerales bacterium]|nr:type II secretion system protein [Phycisphaerales bacterium]
MNNARGRQTQARGTGFTLIEAMVVIIIIAVLAGLVTAVAGRAVRSSRESAERELIRSLSLAVQSFKQDHGVLPPLVNDIPDPVTTATPRRVNLRTEQFLRGEVSTNDPRYSEHSLTYYLMGVLDEDDGTGVPIDGVVGPGFTAPDTSTTGGMVFSKKGRTFDAYFDPLTGGRSRLVRNDPVRITINDRWGTPIRYYRWSTRYEEDRSQPDFGEVLGPDEIGLNIPIALGGVPAVRDELRTAQYAIVSAGPDLLIEDDDRGDLGKLNDDNLAEVGR